MIDLHTHILPQIDDGAKDVSVSAEILRQEQAQGVTQVVLTPHYYGTCDVKEFLSLRKQALERLQAVLPPDITVRLGAEVHFTGVNDPSYETICALAIEGTKYVLFELPFLTDWQEHLLEKIGDFLSETGYVPVIAHIERYAEVLKKPALVAEFARMGCLIQMSTGAFLKKSTASFAVAALKNGLVHAFGTDTHNADHRAPDYTAAKAAVEKAGLSNAWDGVQRCMQHMLCGKPVGHPFGDIKKRFGRYY